MLCLTFSDWKETVKLSEEAAHWSVNWLVLRRHSPSSLLQHQILLCGGIDLYRYCYRIEIVTEAVRPSGSGACLEIWRSRFQDTFWPLVEFVPGSPWFNFSAALVNSQLVCLRPVGILNSCCWLFCSVVIVFHWPWNTPMGSGQLSKCESSMYMIIFFSFKWYTYTYTY